MKLNELLESFYTMDGSALPSKVQPLIKTLRNIENRAVKSYDTMMLISAKIENNIEKLLKHNFIYDNPIDIELFDNSYYNGFPRVLLNQRETMKQNAIKKDIEVISYSNMTRPQMDVVKKSPKIIKLVQQIMKLEKRIQKANLTYEKSDLDWHKKVDQIEKHGVSLDYNFGDILA